ncbi:MAG TPA: ATP-binding protein [Flavobacteriaceae bacterium]|nr:ATP-binding protein [Flavobacteriaceae bacterium]
MKPQLKITLIYLIVGLLWIIVSDWLIIFFFENSELKDTVILQTLKGIFYVTCTAVLLFFLVRNYYKSLNQKMKELERLNEMLKEKTKKLEVSNQELEQFAYVASHDLIEPLRMVTGFITQLERKYKDQLDDKAAQYIFFAVDGAKRMRQIILDLLDYAKVGREDEQKETIDLNEVVNDVLLFQKKLIEEKNADISIQNLPVIKSFKAPIFQVFHNLINNALRFSRENIPPKVVISAKEDEKFWYFTIQDNGVGIEEAYYEKIFVIFQRLHNQDIHKGNGMGLPLVKKIIKTMGGNIWVTSVLGKGSTFHFTLPKS